jgi:hypothetical protein
MAPPTERTLSVHAMVRGAHEWYCMAKNPRCRFVTKDTAEMLGHVTGQQQDLRHLKPLPFPADDVERVA